MMASQHEDVADILIEKIFSCLKLQEKCADKLESLAAELEKNKKGADVSKIVGSSVSVGGAAALTTAGVLTFFTGGLAAPLLVAAGSAATAVGVGTNVASDVVDLVLSSSTMKDAEKTAEEIENLEKEIEKGMNLLKEEGKRRENLAGAFCDLSPDDYVVERILRAMAKRSELLLNDGVSLHKVICGLSKKVITEKFKKLGRTSVALLVRFVLKSVAKHSSKAVARQVGQRGAAKAVGRVVGGAVGLVLSTWELVDNCKELDKPVEASESLRKNAKDIRSAAEELRKDLDDIEKALQRLASIIASIENPKRSPAEKKILIEFAVENCQDEITLQWLRENSESETFFKLIDTVQSLKEKTDEEKEKNHDIVLVTHGEVTDSMIPASSLLPLAIVTDVLLHQTYGGKMKPQDKDIPKDNRQPSQSVRKAGGQMIPNFMVSLQPQDAVWETSTFLPNKYGPAGRNQYELKGKKKFDPSDRVPFFVLTFVLSLVLDLYRIKVTVHLVE